MVQKTAKAVIIFQFSCTNTRINSGVDTIELTQRNRFNGFQHIPLLSISRNDWQNRENHLLHDSNLEF